MKRSRRPSAAPGRISVLVAALLAVAGCETITGEPELEPELELETTIQPAAPGTLELAKRALAEHRYIDAKRLLDRVLIAEPENREANLVLGELLLANGLPGQAAGAFQRLIDSPEVAAPALQGHGIALMLTGEQERGFESLRAAVEQNPELWRAWNALGYYYDTRQDWAMAVESYGNAIDVKSDSALIYNNRGFSMLMQKRVDEAIADLDRALRLDPGFEIAQENMRLALAWKGKYIHAMSGTPDRDLARVLNNIGFIALMRGDYKNAESYLLRAMEIDPSYNEVASRNLNYLKHIQDLNKAEATGITN